VIKTNANQRYLTNTESATHFIALCESAGVLDNSDMIAALTMMFKS